MRCADIRADIPKLSGTVIDSKARVLNGGYPRPTVNGMSDQGRSRSGEHRMYRALFSVEKWRWLRFGELADNRAEVLRRFIAWYDSEPGAKLPRRPKPPE
jgi:hypothetical protein